jgi:hypothetical protein
MLIRFRQTHENHEPHLLILLGDLGPEVAENNLRLYRLVGAAITTRTEATKVPEDVGW